MQAQKMLFPAFLLLSICLLAACSNKTNITAESSLTPVPSMNDSSSPTTAPTDASTMAPTVVPTMTPTIVPSASDSNDANAIHVVANPDSIVVLVNKQNALPANFTPTDLVYPNVPFTFTEKVDKRKMRQVAATALEKLFAGAEKDNIYLAGVSAYRSYATQTSLFNSYAKTYGYDKARTFSALPGTSEHETGLAIDVSGIDGKCQATECFADTKEAKWLAQHAAEYGFIVRYPQGDQAITGYVYEPWHLRYVGVDVSTTITKENTTLEQYLQATEVSK